VVKASQSFDKMSILCFGKNCQNANLKISILFWIDRFDRTVSVSVNFEGPSSANKTAIDLGESKVSSTIGGALKLKGTCYGLAAKIIFSMTIFQKIMRHWYCSYNSEMIFYTWVCNHKISQNTVELILIK